MRLFVVMLLGLMLCGCTTVYEGGMNQISKRIKIGMTEKQVYDIEGCPEQRSRQVINGKIYENWGWTSVSLTLNFVDGILMGYGYGGIYVSQNGREDARDLK